MANLYMFNEEDIFFTSNPVEWATWEKKVDRRIGLDEKDDTVVSTVFFGIGRKALPPILFETLVLKKGNDLERERAASLDQARKNHQAMVDKYL